MSAEDTRILRSYVVGHTKGEAALARLEARIAELTEQVESSVPALHREQVARRTAEARLAEAELGSDATPELWKRRQIVIREYKARIADQESALAEWINRDCVTEMDEAQGRAEAAERAAEKLAKERSAAVDAANHWKWRADKAEQSGGPWGGTSIPAINARAEVAEARVEALSAALREIDKQASPRDWETPGHPPILRIARAALATSEQAPVGQRGSK